MFLVVLPKPWDFSFRWQFFFSSKSVLGRWLKLLSWGTLQKIAVSFYLSTRLHKILIFSEPRRSSMEDISTIIFTGWGTSSFRRYRYRGSLHVSFCCFPLIKGHFASSVPVITAGTMRAQITCFPFNFSTLSKIMKGAGAVYFFNSRKFPGPSSVRVHVLDLFLLFCLCVLCSSTQTLQGDNFGPSLLRTYQRQRWGLGVLVVPYAELFPPWFLHLSSGFRRSLTIWSSLSMSFHDRGVLSHKGSGWPRKRQASRFLSFRSAFVYILRFVSASLTEMVEKGSCFFDSM